MKSHTVHAIIAAIALTGLAQATPTDDMKPFYESFTNAQSSGDAATIDRLIDDQLVFIHGGGRITTKADFLHDFTGPDFKLDPIAYKNQHFVEIAPDVVIMTADVSYTGAEGGKAFVSNFHVSDVWARRGDLWKLTFVQNATLAAPPK